jgi:hypothetical protein
MISGYEIHLERKQDFKMKYSDWYKQDVVLFNILPQLKDKECVFLGDVRVRNIKVNCMANLKSNLTRYSIGDKKANLYLSFANFKDLPYFSFKPETRKEESKIFNLEASNYYETYDLGIDFDDHDGKNFNQMYQQAYQLKEVFDKYKIAYAVKCSGSGFHFDIQHKNLPTKIQESKGSSKIELIKKLVKELVMIYNLTTVDTGRNKEGVADGSFYALRRIWKVAYSWDIKTDNIALPLTDHQFENFTFEIVKPDYVIKNIKLFKRGMLYRYGSEQNFNKLVEEILEWEV